MNKLTTLVAFGAGESAAVPVFLSKDALILDYLGYLHAMDSFCLTTVVRIQDAVNDVFAKGDFATNAFQKLIPLDGFAYREMPKSLLVALPVYLSQATGLPVGRFGSFLGRLEENGAAAEKGSFWGAMSRWPSVLALGGVLGAVGLVTIDLAAIRDSGAVDHWTSGFTVRVEPNALEKIKFVSHNVKIVEVAPVLCKKEQLALAKVKEARSTFAARAANSGGVVAKSSPVAPSISSLIPLGEGVAVSKGTAEAAVSVSDG